MRRRVVVMALTVVVALGIGWYVTAQNGQNGSLPTFQDGDVLFAADLNAIARQVEANTAALSSDGLVCRAILSRAQEAPTIPEGGTITEGTITVQFDAGLSQAMIDLTLAGDPASAARAHFHCALPGESGSIVFGIVDPGPEACDPADLAAGALACTVTNADFTEADCTETIGRSVSNIAALFFAARQGLIYANVHTAENPAGEVRGQLLCEN
jgi:hypothetical protein